MLIAGVDPEFVAAARELRTLSMAVDFCADGSAALERIGLHSYDVVVLDSELPEVSADDVVRK